MCTSDNDFCRDYHQKNNPNNVRILNILSAEGNIQRMSVLNIDIL